MKECLNYFAIIFLLFLSSCGTSKVQLDNKNVYSNYCFSPTPKISIDTVPKDQFLKDTVLSKRYDESELLLANAYGFIEDLRSFEVLRGEVVDKGVSKESIVEYARLNNRLNERLELAELDIQNLIDLIDCTTLQLTKFNSYLSSENSYRQRKLSNGAIVVGGLTAVLTAGILISNEESIKESDLLDWIAVGGGVVTTYLAIKSNRVDKQVQLEPKSNFIKSIWFDDNSYGYFSGASWYLMNNTKSYHNQHLDLREQIIYEWKNSEAMLNDPNNSIYLDSLLADKAVYSESMIQLRIDMLDTISNQLKQLIRLIYTFNIKKY